MPFADRYDSPLIEVDPLSVYSVLMGAVGAAVISQLTWGNVYPIPVSLGMLGGYAFGAKLTPSSSGVLERKVGKTYSNNF